MDRLAGGRQPDAERIAGRRDGTGQELQQLRVVAAVQRDLVDLLAGDDAADVAGLGFDLGGHGRDRNGLGQGEQSNRRLAYNAVHLAQYASCGERVPVAGTSIGGRALLGRAGAPQAAVARGRAWRLHAAAVPPTIVGA
jgi:hypothetical protein